jgi:hypothetical protein
MGTTFVTLLNMGMVSFSLLGKKRYGDRWLVTGPYKKTSSLGPKKKKIGKDNLLHLNCFFAWQLHILHVIYCFGDPTNLETTTRETMK